MTEDAIMQAFSAVLISEDAVRGAEKNLRDEKLRLELELRKHEGELTVAWGEVCKALEAAGKIEAILPGDLVDYKICWSRPSKSVKILDDKAVPEEYLAPPAERKPKLLEIKKHLNNLAASNLPLPNWATLESGESKLGWEAVKRKPVRRSE